MQGGKPKIWQDPDTKLWHIQHRYMEGSPEVVTHISPKERGSVVINGIEYDTSLLWEFEGKPCEEQSRKVAGEGYTRTASEKE